MNTRSIVLALTLAAAAPCVADAMPVAQPIPLAGAEAPAATQVYWHGYGWRRHHGWHRHYGWHRHWGWRRHWHRRFWY